MCLSLTSSTMRYDGGHQQFAKAVQTAFFAFISSEVDIYILRYIPLFPLMEIIFRLGGICG